MRKLCMFIGISLVLTVGFVVSNSTSQERIHAQDEREPSYAKWGQLAMKETKSKYPNAEIVDYLHIGQEITGNSTIEKFKLWLNEESQEFGVFVTIEFNTATNEVVHITFEKTDR